MTANGDVERLEAELEQRRRSLEASIKRCMQ